MELPDNGEPLGIYWMTSIGETDHGAGQCTRTGLGLFEIVCSCKCPLLFHAMDDWKQKDHYVGDNTRRLRVFKDNVFLFGNIVWNYGKNFDPWPK